MIGQYQQVRWLEAKAGTNDVPAFGLVEIIGAVWEAPGRTVLLVERPSDNSCRLIAINSWKPIAAGDYGLVTCEGPNFVLYKHESETDPEPGLGEYWGSEKDKFPATQGQRGLVIVGGVDTERHIVCVNFDAGCCWMIGKISGGAISSESTGTVTRYNQLWVITDPVETYSVLNPH